MRILGIDYGDVRVGIALTDPLGITAQGVETIHYNGKDKELLKRIDEIIQQYGVSKIVLGMPINLKGEETVRAQKTKMFLHKLKCKYPKIEIIAVDERLTTVQAHKTMNELEIKNGKKKDIVDTLSAVYILETYINKKIDSNY